MVMMVVRMAASNPRELIFAEILQSRIFHIGRSFK
jgi:hypothetical protein